MTCCHSNSSVKPSVNTDVKNSKGVNNNNNNNNNIEDQRTCRIVDFAVPVGQGQTERKRKERYVP